MINWQGKNFGKYLVSSNLFPSVKKVEGVILCDVPSSKALIATQLEPTKTPIAILFDLQTCGTGLLQGAEFGIYWNLI